MAASTLLFSCLFLTPLANEHWTPGSLAAYILTSLYNAGKETSISSTIGWFFFFSPGPHPHRVNNSGLHVWKVMAPHFTQTHHASCHVDHFTVYDWGYKSCLMHQATKRKGELSLVWNTVVSTNSSRKLIVSCETPIHRQFCIQNGPLLYFQTISKIKFNCCFSQFGISFGRICNLYSWLQWLQTDLSCELRADTLM